uniref:Uncharacterized protein n=1 Tax=Panagrolaimus superbus TaxID=310955 RepID=A0A914XZ98_9BILA
MVERIFTEMQNIADELAENKADYLQLLDQSPPLWTNVQKVIFQARIHELQINIDSWKENVTKLESKANVMKNDDATAKQEMFTRIDTVKQTQRSLLKDVKRIILEGTGYLRVSILPPVQAVTPPPITPTILQIPALNIQKFNGDYLKWKPFWQRFGVNVDNRPFSNVEKLDALIGLLEGVALEEVAGFEIADENYDTVVKTLQQRFGNEKIH